MANTCFLCDKSFSTASNLRRHARLIHNVENKVSTCRQMKCNVCSEELVSMKALLNHVESAHNIAIEKETKKFDTYEAFKIWKEDVEKQTTALYVKNTGSKFNDMKKTTYFYCHRNGFYNARGDKKRTIKMAGSNKINGNCPSKMKVCEGNENQVYVEFTKTHLGHGKDLGRMQITREEKDELARKLEKKIPIEIILDGIRDSFIDRLERIHLVTRKDLLNLKAEYSISSEGIMDTNDVLSVGKWVHSLQGREDSPVILFKDQNTYDEVLYPGLKSEDFLLVIMNRCQREMLSFYGNDTICLDFTHGMNAYGFDLATILVLDDKREGFPAAFILSNRQDSKALSVAFAAIKEHVSISPKVMMTDDTESFLNAWRTVFGVPEKRLLYTWHVDRSWRRSIVKLIKKPENQIQAYKVVRCLLMETEEEAFYIRLQEALKIFNETDEFRAFKNYFEHVYCKRTEAWAYCHRKWLGINTNMHIESMHRTIKYVYLLGIKVKRLDRALFYLMKFVRDRVFDRLICLEKGKISSKIAQLRKRHKVGQELTSLCIRKNEEEWSVASTKSNEIYIVKKNVACSEGCTLMCKECKQCLHNFTCTCIDNAIQWNMCKHIHYICSRNLNEINSAVPEDEGLSVHSPIVDEEEMVICEDRKFLEKATLVDNLRATATRKTTSKEEFQKKCTELINTISPELYDNVLSFLQNASDSSHFLSQANQEAVPKNLNKEPPNKKIKTQRYVSTKKTSQKASTTFRKPTQEECQSISSSLILPAKTKQE
ncbi:uncharacterized protein NPIL_356961 [Nephila pilipes]|uniref:C2H2-type domain-containing protein n=1 Tax=Nephila pilipes TaxID=299642 RepID=A0A8X6IMZ2_NEPPI|nr:uncharacterized protein NPIL_356961 [Nephila pilipes]